MSLTILWADIANGNRSFPITRQPSVAVCDGHLCDHHTWSIFGMTITSFQAVCVCVLWETAIRYNTNAIALSMTREWTNEKKDYGKRRRSKYAKRKRMNNDLSAVWGILNASRFCAWTFRMSCMESFRWTLKCLACVYHSHVSSDEKSKKSLWHGQLW